MRQSKIVLRLIGLLSIALAAFGLIYIGISLLLSAFPNRLTNNPPYFLPTFYVMAAAVVLIEVAIAWSGWSFVKGNVARVFPFIVACACTEALPIIVRRLADHPSIGHSIAAATGISTGGIYLQWAIRFPIWAPLIVLLIWWYGIGRTATT
jgi:hypothetical protein